MSELEIIIVPFIPRRKQVHAISLSHASKMTALLIWMRRLFLRFDLTMYIPLCLIVLYYHGFETARDEHCCLFSITTYFQWGVNRDAASLDDGLFKIKNEIQRL